MGGLWVDPRCVMGGNGLDWFYSRLGLVGPWPQQLMTRHVDRYQDQDVSFSDTRECTLLKELLESVDEADVERFTNAIFEFDQISKLDKWKTTILLRIKTALNDMEGDMR